MNTVQIYKRHWVNKTPRGIAGVIDLDDLDVKNATCTIHAASGYTGTRCGGPAIHFYVKNNSRGVVVLPRCESHQNSDPHWGEGYGYDRDWAEISREDLLNLQLVEETMKE